jgi:two-component system, chemotaxis family, protein-glutamate methylesterase/glutaminase
VAHAYTADGMLDEKAEALESALYVALNTLEESAEMSRTLAVRARAQTRPRRGAL